MYGISNLSAKLLGVNVWFLGYVTPNRVIPFMVSLYHARTFAHKPA